MKKIDLINDSPLKLFFRYLVPSISATLVTSIYILADSMMIGNGIGPNGIAALNIVIPMFTLFFGTGLLFGVGGSIFMAISHGDKDYVTGNKYFTTSFYSTICISIITLIIIQIFLGPIVKFLGATEVTYDYAVEYGRYLSMGAPIFMLNSLLQNFIRNDKDPNTAMAGVIAGGVTNVILDYILIYIYGLEMKGGAIATVCGGLVTISILLTHFFRKSNNIKLIHKGYSFKLLGKIITNGFASFLIEMSSGIVTTVFNLQLVRYIGDLGVTVYSILANSSFVISSLANGVSQACQPIIAVNYGAEKLKRVAKIKNLGIITSLIIAGVIVILGFTFPTFLTAIFVKPTNDILAISIPAIRKYIIAYFFMFLSIFSISYFQSVIKPAYAMGVTMLRGLILSIVFVVALPLVLGADGIWFAMPLSEIITFLVVICLMKKMHKEMSTN